MERKLNLGSGKDIRYDYLNLDKIKYPGIDVLHDLEKYPYPFPKNTFSEILAKDIIEHIYDTYEVLRELHRITKPNGIIKIRVPHCQSPGAWGDITHKRAFSCDSFKHYDLIANGSTLETERIKIKRKYIKIIFHGMHVRLGISWLFNKSRYMQTLFERYFSGIFTPQNLYFELEVIK